MKSSFNNRKLARFLDPILDPGKHRQPGQWLDVFLAALALWWAWRLCKQLTYFMGIMNFDLPGKSALQFGLFDLIYYPIFLYLAYDRRKWGWFLLVGFYSFGIVSGLIAYLLSLYYSMALSAADLASPLLFFSMLNALCIAFMWHKTVSDQYGIDLYQKRTTIILAGAVSFLFSTTAFVLWHRLL